MILMFENISFKLFGQVFLPYLGYFDKLKISLRKARIEMHIHQYLCLITFYAFPLTFFVCMIVLSTLISIITGSLLYSLTTSAILSALASLSVFAMGYYYPNTRISSLKKKIEKSLPFAATYMMISASSGMNPVDMFKMLSARGGVIGKEAEVIYNNIKSLGMSLSKAIQYSAQRSPSPMFSDLLYGMNSVIASGGELDVYLQEKAKTIFSHYRRSLEEYARALTIYAEIYITLIIVGTLFFMILISIISPVVKGIVSIQAFIVFAFTPFVSMIFIVLLKSISPEE